MKDEIPSNIETIAPTNVYDTTSLDLRDHGAVNPIQDQGHCGGCWAFSITAAIEGARVIQNSGSLEKFAEQQQIDCSRKSFGCDGGIRGASIQEMADNGTKAERESDYGHYLARDSTCKYDASKGLQGVSRAAYIKGEPQYVKASLAKYGTLAVGIDASPIQYYRSGIFTSACTGRRNHAVNIVGYGVEGGQEYWIMRNSWGTGFGEHGYFRLPTGVNQCNVESDVVAAVL